MQRKNLVLAAAAFTTDATRVQQHAGTHHTLPLAPSSPDPYAKLQGGVAHHMTPEQESPSFTDGPAPASPRGAPGGVWDVARPSQRDCWAIAGLTQAGASGRWWLSLGREQNNPMRCNHENFRRDPMRIAFPAD